MIKEDIKTDKAQQNEGKPKAAEKKKEEKKEEKKVSKEQARIEELEKQLAEANDKLAKEKNDYLRLMAEFETFRRRSAEDKLNMVSTASAETIKGLLPTLDECERALQILEKSSDEAAREGTKLIYDKMMGYLKSKGLEKIEAKGEKFDVDLHEAVTQFPAPSEDLKGKVIDVVQAGYKLNGKILRYAKVVVGA